MMFARINVYPAKNIFKWLMEQKWAGTIKYNPEPAIDNNNELQNATTVTINLACQPQIDACSLQR